MVAAVASTNVNISENIVEVALWLVNSTLEMVCNLFMEVLYTGMFDGFGQVICI